MDVPDSWLCAQVATAIRGAIILAKMSIVPVRRGYWGNKIGRPHTVPTKVCPMLLVRVLPFRCLFLKAGYPMRMQVLAFR